MALRPLTASETVYFHGETFARPGTFTDGLPLLHTEAKVRVSDLGATMLAAALLDLERQGALRLASAKASRLFGLRKVDALEASPLARPPQPPATLEARLLDALSDKAREAERVVHDALEEDATDPRAIPIWLAQRGMVEAGILETTEERRLKVFKVQGLRVPDATRALVAATDPATVRALLDAGKARADVWPLLEKAVDKAIAGRKEYSNDGPD